MTPDQIEQIINMLAEKLGPLGEHVWTVYLRQVYVEVAANVMWALAALLGAIGCGLLLRRAMKIRDEVDRGIACALIVLGLIACVIMAMMTFTEGALPILNPEYHAIEMLLGR